MPQRTGASLADEIRALGRLVPADARTRDAILTLLHGVAPSVGAAPQRPTAPAPPPPGPPIELPPFEPPAPPLKPPAPPGPNPPEPLRPEYGRGVSFVDVTIVRRLSSRPVAQLPAGRDEPLPAPPPSADRAPTSAPILASRHARAVFKLLAATLGEVNAPDLPRLLARVSRGLPVTRIPRRRALTVRRGVQLLVDWGSALAPFAADREQVCSGLVRLLGRDRVELVGFAGSPTRKTGSGPRSAWQAGWQAPAPGVPVLVVSDVGLAGSAFDDDWASPAEWAQFAALARANGNAVIVLSPFGPQRWPVALRRSFTWVPWSEALSAAQLNRIRRDAAARR